MRWGAKTATARTARAVLRCYRLGVSPLLHAIAGSGFGCRFQMTCGEFAARAVLRHGLPRGGWLAAVRLARCQPFAGRKLSGRAAPHGAQTRVAPAALEG